MKFTKIIAWQNRRLSDFVFHLGDLIGCTIRFVPVYDEPIREVKQLWYSVWFKSFQQSYEMHSSYFESEIEIKKVYSVEFYDIV